MNNASSRSGQFRSTRLVRQCAALACCMLLSGCSESPAPVATMPAKSAAATPISSEISEEANPDATAVISASPLPPAASPEPAKGPPSTPQPAPAEPKSSATNEDNAAPEKAATASVAPQGKPEKKSETKSPAKAEPKPAAEVDYFRQLPNALDLPAAPQEGQEAKPVALGSAVLPTSVICIVHLLGGESAHRGARKIFRCEEEAAENPVRNWRIDLVSGGETTAIARLAFRDGKLWFNWLPAAAEDTAVASLANCALGLNAGSKKKTISLRKAVHVGAMSIGLERTSGQWEIANLPRLEKVKVELRLVADKRLRYRFIGPSSLSLDKEETFLSFGLGRNDQSVRLKLDMSLSRFLKLSSVPQMQLATHPKPVLVTSDLLKRNESELKRNLAVLEKQLEALTAARSSKSSGSTSKGQDPRALLQSQIKQLELAQEQLKQAQALAPELAKARLQVRVFYEAEEALVDLLIAQGASPKP